MLVNTYQKLFYGCVCVCGRESVNVYMCGYVSVAEDEYV